MFNGVLSIRDITEDTILDAFRVCSFNKLDDPLQKEGMRLKEEWLRGMLKDFGACTKIAYVEERPVAQILYLPEEAVPFIPQPRERVVLLNCVYNPFAEFKRKGVATALMEALIDECRMGLPILEGQACKFVVAKPFEAREGFSMADFYRRFGFREGSFEMHLEIAGVYEAREPGRYVPIMEDEGRVVVFFDVMCEWGFSHASRVEQVINEVAPDVDVELINPWERPEEYLKRGNHWLVVNAKPIKSYVTQGQKFRDEVLEALKD